MNPFDLPPSTPPVSIEPPDPPAPRRGRMAIVALASAGLLAGGVVGVSALVSADDPELEPTLESSGVAAAATADDESPGDTGDDGGEPEGDGLPSIDGEIVIETGDGEPIVIDVGELADLAKDQLAQLEECTGVPLWLDIGPMLPPPDGELEFEGDLDEMFQKFEEMLGEWTGDGALLDAPLFGDGMFAEEIGTGEVTITTEGTATETPLDDLFGELLGEFQLPEDFDLDDLQLGEFFPEGIEEMMKDFSGEFESFEFGDVDPQQIADCLADLG